MADTIIRRNIFTGELEEVPKPDWKPSKKTREYSGSQTYTEARPRMILSGGCHPNQVAEFNQMIEELGLTASLHHEPDGTLRCTSKSALQIYMKERGMIDWDE